MKLVVLFTGLVSKNHLSGGDQLFLDLAPRLPKEINLVVVTPQFSLNHWRGVKKHSTEFRPLKQNVFDLHENPLFVFCSYLIRAWQTYQILSKEKGVDAIYSCSDVALGDIWPAYAVHQGKPHIKWITRIYHILLHPTKRHGNIVINVIAFYLQRFSFLLIKSKSQSILALNEKLKDELLELHFPRKKVGVLGAGVDYKKIKAFRPKQKKGFDAVVLARIAPVKGIYDLVEIWKMVRKHNPNRHVAWIGSGGGYEGKFKKKIKENGLTKNVHLLGFLPKETILTIFKNSKLFLCTDHENGWGLAISEAMAAGLPVVSFRIDIFDGVYKKGFVSVPLHDNTRFAQEIIRLLEDRNKRLRLSREAESQASTFDLDQVAQQLVSVLKS